MSDVQEQNGFGSLGFWMLGILYLFQMIGSVMSAAFVQQVGIVKTLVFGFICLSTVILSEILSAWRADQDKAPGDDGYLDFLYNKNTVITVLILSSILSGFGCALIWVA